MLLFVIFITFIRFHLWKNICCILFQLKFQDIAWRSLTYYAPVIEASHPSGTNVIAYILWHNYVSLRNFIAFTQLHWFPPICPFCCQLRIGWCYCPRTGSKYWGRRLLWPKKPWSEHVSLVWKCHHSMEGTKIYSQAITRDVIWLKLPL